MEWLQTLFDRFTEAFKWWFILQPWEQALRVRAGRWIRKFEGGIHFRIPYLDSIFIQNCRMRVSDMGHQTITTRDLKTLTIAGQLKYRVEDVTPLYTMLHTAEETLTQVVQATVTQYIANRDVLDCHPDKLMAYVNDQLNFERYGLAEVEYAVTDFANVRTYRLINEGFATYNGFSLATNEKDDV
jgi:regulator of protease activity HflC (stomatin/prohibitin superfamily)